MVERSYRWALEEVAGLLASRWVPAVLTALAAGPLRYTELLTEIRDTESRLDRIAVSDKSLARTLRLLEEAQLIERHSESGTFAAATWYQLSHNGKTFILALREAMIWAIDHADSLTDKAPE